MDCSSESMLVSSNQEKWLNNLIDIHPNQFYGLPAEFEINSFAVAHMTVTGKDGISDLEEAENQCKELNASVLGEHLLFYAPVTKSGNDQYVIAKVHAVV